MYVRRALPVRDILFDSWRVVLFAAAWSSLVVYLYEIQGMHFLAVPVLPVTTIGIAVSLYLGFKSSSSYNRWWEARAIWGEIVNNSRTWANYAHNLVYDAEFENNNGVARDLIERHVAWVNALAHQLRKTSRLKVSHNLHVFDYRRPFTDPGFHPNPESYLKHLRPEERSYIAAHGNPATHILRLQGEKLRELAKQGLLSDYRLVEMMAHIGRFYDCQGKCERIKNTPFPRQIAHFGTIFAWLFIVLLPFAFVDAFNAEFARSHIMSITEKEYVFALVPFATIISWIFFIIEKVSDSSEDPFEGGATDVPISTLSRTIEIDMKQFLDEKETPEPLKVLKGIAY